MELTVRFHVNLIFCTYLFIFILFQRTKIEGGDVPYLILQPSLIYLVLSYCHDRLNLSEIHTMLTIHTHLTVHCLILKVESQSAGRGSLSSVHLLPRTHIERGDCPFFPILSGTIRPCITVYLLSTSGVDSNKYFQMSTRNIIRLFLSSCHSFLN